MPHTICREAWTYEELSDSAKGTARDEWRIGHLDHEWWDCVYEDAKECAKLIGIDIDNIWFSGFSSQGDGACWVGTYSYAKGGLKAIRSHAPRNKELHEIAATLQEVQQRYFYTIGARSKHNGSYCHEYTMDIEAETDSDVCGRWLDQADYELLRDALRSFAKWIYHSLEEDYDYQMEDEQIEESITSTEVEFNENGKLIKW